MTHPDTHPGSLPADRFDQWLDALVAGTPADETSLNGTDGSLGRAITGARQLHGLAGATSPAAAAQRRIEEDLMRSGTLAAPRGTTWIPNKKVTRRTPWWSPASPAIAAALVVVLIVALGASFIATQRPADAPTGVPGFAMASPEAREPAPVSSLPIVEGDPSDDLRSQLGSYGVIDDAGLTIIRPSEDDLAFPGVTAAMPNGVPGEAVLTRDDGSRSVVDLTTGETRFDLPPAFGNETQVGTYLFIPESDENADWTIYDLRTGESRPLAQIVDLPADQPALPVSFGPDQQGSSIVFMQFVTPEFETAATSDIPSFVIAGSLDRATTLDGYPPASQARESLPVTSQDGTTVAWVATGPENAIIVADTATGEQLARVKLGDVGQEAIPAGFTRNGSGLVVTTGDRVLLIGWSPGEVMIATVAEGLTGAFSPLFSPLADSLYYYEGDALQRMTVPDANVTTVLDGVDFTSLPLYAAPGSPWILVTLDTGIALIDARTGDVVSNLLNIPPNEAEFGALSLSISHDGSTVIMVIGGPDSAYLVSPDYPEGLVLTAPIDPDIIAASESPNGIPVNYTLSPDGGSVAASTIDGVATPRFVAEVGPNPEWVAIEDTIDALYWLPMPASERADDTNDVVALSAQDFASPEASPVAASATGPVMVIEGTSGEARIENGVRIATLGDAGLTLPIEPGVWVSLPKVAQVRTIWGHADTLHVIRDDGTEAVIDLATGDVLFDIPAFQSWARGSGRWQFVPIDDTLADWTVIDMTTGDTRPLSELVSLPGDTAVMPISELPQSSDDVEVFRLELGTPEATGWVTTDPAARTFVIAGSLDRVTSLPDYPTLRDNVGSPALVASADGDIVAYETRAGDSRIVVLDVTSGKVLGRYSATEVGDNPTLAGFTEDDNHLVVTTGDRVLLVNWRGDPPFIVAEGFENIDNPLLFVPDAVLYVRQVDTLLRIDMPSGEVTEVATGLVPAPFDFTTPGGNWIVAQTREGHIMVDTRTGEVVSRMKPDPAQANFLLDEGRHPAWSDADGDTFFIALTTTPTAPDATNATPAVWLLSPDFPDGLEVSAPADVGNAWLSPDGETLYAYTSERMSGPGTVWRTPLGAEPDWQVVVEDVTPLPNPTMFFPEG